MCDDDPFRLEGIVVHVRQLGVYELDLPNGHRLLGYVVQRERNLVSDLRVGDRVEVEVSPCDLSKGRVRMKKEKRDESQSFGEATL